jgi:hypothetical protein
MFTVDLDALGATVLVLYLLPMGLEKLKVMLEKWLRQSEDRRLVTITYSVPGWDTDTAKPVDKFWLFYYDRNNLKP